MERKKLTREQVEQIVREAREKGEWPDFNGVDLSEIDLRKADLSGADLSEADLSGADLTETNLTKTTLVGQLVKAWASLLPPA